MNAANSQLRRRITILAALAVLCACTVASARFRQPNDESAPGRAKLRAGVDGPIVISGYTGHEDASEVAIFFQEPSFYYLTGHDEPGAVLLIARDRPATEGQAAPPPEGVQLPQRTLDTP